jgi:hypothetical protein
MIVVVVVIVFLPIAYALWWAFGPGAIQRRKKARQAVWLDVHLGAIGRSESPRLQPRIDREALEREVRRYD